MIVVLVSLFTAVFVWLNLFSIGPGTSGSDHYFHLSLIRSIKKRGHRFIVSHPQLCDETYTGYPQLYHWLLSLLPMNFQSVAAVKAVIGAVVSLQFVSFCLFVVYIDQNIVFLRSDGISFLLLSSLLFASTPFQYSIWNAKNMGLSARSFGILLGQLYLYSIFYYGISQNPCVLLLSIGIAVLTLLGSQFAAQMVILSAPILAIVMGDFSYIAIPPAALLIYFVVMPKQCMNFCKGQFWHKYLFCRYMAPSFLWAHRYSVWRDFVFDFWSGRGLKGKVKYVLNNPLICIIVGIPVIVLLVGVVSLDEGFRRVLLDCSATKTLLQIVLALFLVFWVTSFRKTRFLGEPERYMEFAIPFVSVLGAVLYESYAIWIYLLLTYSVGMTALQLTLGARKRRNVGESSQQDMMEAVSWLNEKIEEDTAGVKMLSNNRNLAMTAIGKCQNIQVVRTNVTAPYTGSLHFTEIYPVRFGTMSVDAVVRLIKEFAVNWYVHDEKKGGVPQADGMKLDEQFAAGQFKVFKVCCVNSVNRS